MGKRDDPTKIRTARDADNYLLNAGCTTQQNGSSHKIYKHPKIGESGNKYPFFTVPQHPGEMNPNIRRALIRAILAAGLVITLVVAFLGG